MALAINRAWWHAPHACISQLWLMTPPTLWWRRTCQRMKGHCSWDKFSCMSNRYIINPIYDVVWNRDSDSLFEIWLPVLLERLLEARIAPDNLHTGMYQTHTPPQPIGELQLLGVLMAIGDPAATPTDADYCDQVSQMLLWFAWTTHLQDLHKELIVHIPSQIW